MFSKPECYVKDKKIPEIYSGTPTFMGLPRVDSQAKMANYDLAFVGAPWEGICTWGGYTGCELAVKSIRKASVRYGAYLPEYDSDAFDYLNGCDYGDIAVDRSNTEKTLNNIEAKVSEILNNDVFPITFGGDHSITYPIIRALSKKHKGKVGIIHLDAHLDNLDLYGNSKYARCSPFRRAYELENLNPGNIIHLGIRGPRNNPKGMKAAREAGACVLTSFEIKEKGIEYTIKKALGIAKKNTEAVYVSICSDVLDVAFNPGGPPDFCGLSSYELAKILYGIAAAGIDGFDIVEIYPPSDINDVSSHAAVWMVVYILNGLIKSNSAQLNQSSKKDD